MLYAYIKLLMMMFFCSACKHMTKVTAIYFFIQEPIMTFKAMMYKENVAHLLRAIFVAPPLWG